MDVGSSSSRWFRKRKGAFPRILFSDQRNESRRTPEQKLFTRFLHIAWRIAGDIAHRVAERLGTAMPPPFDGLHAIGVDETSHRKGHTYLTVVVDHERHRVIWAHGGYGGDVFDLFFKALTPGQRESIRVVTGDGTHWIDPCTGRWCPAAERVLDGFHIVSWMTDALDGIRNTDRGPALPFMATQGTIEDPAQAPARTGQGRVEALGVPGLAFTHTRDRRTGEEDPTPPAGHPAHDPAGYSNAKLEAFNNRIKVTIRMAYGFHHVDNLIALITLKCGGLDIRLPQPTI